MSHPLPNADDEDLAQVHRRALRRLREMGMALAERLHAAGEAPEADVGEMASRFAHVARAVRHTIALEARLADDGRRLAESRAREAAAEAARAQRPPAWDPSARARLARAEPTPAEKKLEAIGLLHRAIARDGDRERLTERFHERLTDVENYDVVLTCQSVAQAIAHICRDLGFTPDWLGLSDRDWKLARAETRAILRGDPPAVAVDQGRRPPAARALGP